MKMVINDKLYDTEKAVLVAKYSNGLSRRDFKHLYEDLYITSRGQFFVHCEGGPLTKYNEKSGNCRYGVETIVLYTPQEAYEWLIEHNKAEAIEQYFSDRIQEG